MEKKFALSLSTFCIVFLGILYFGGWKNGILDAVVIIMLAAGCLYLAYTFFFQEEEPEQEALDGIKKDKKENHVLQKKVTCVAEGKDEEITVNVRVIVSRRDDIAKAEGASAAAHLTDSDKADMPVAGKAKIKEIVNAIPDKADEKKRNDQKSNVRQILLNPTRNTLEDWNIQNFVFTSLNNGVQRFKLIDGKYVYPKNEYVGKRAVDMKVDLNPQQITKIFDFPSSEKLRHIIKNIVPAEVKKINPYEYELIKFGKIEIDEESEY